MLARLEDMEEFWVKEEVDFLAAIISFEIQRN
jgi:hypothetical protein